MSNTKIPTLLEWITQRQLTEDFSNAEISFVNVYNNKQSIRIPVAIEDIKKLPISLIPLLRTYITAKVSETPYSSLNLGVRFAIAKKPETDVKIYIWPQHALHDNVLKVIDTELYNVYTRLRHGNTSDTTFLFTGTLLAADHKIQSNESVQVVNTQVKKLYPQFITDFKLTAQDIKFFK